MTADSATNDVVLITGGSRGIGAATARLLASRGWNVCISFAGRADAARGVVEDCERLGAAAFAVQADVSKEPDVERLFAAVDTEFGRLDGLVNNAGIVSPAGRVSEYSADRISHVLAVNVLGAFLCAREAVRRMERAGRGVIVNVSSRAAVLGSAGEYVDYAASKAAVDALTIGLAGEVAASGIRVAGVRPGLIETEIHAPGRLDRLAGTVPMKRSGTIGEVAAAIAWLLSPEASFVTGTSLDVSGGR